jgi:hypothetical protein
MKGFSMKTLRVALLGLLALSCAGAVLAQPSVSVDVGYFYDNLASSGNWIQSPSYGWVWTPQSVSASWRPYQNGNWVATDQGWTWVSNESYGWATYHYGRWYDDPSVGWYWVPGTEWAPAWVSWQEGGNYIGWAPLPPSVVVGAGFNGALSVSLEPALYLFVPEREFLAPRLSSYYVPQDRVAAIYGQTRNFTNYRNDGGRVYNNGIGVDQIQRAVGRPVPHYQLADLNARGASRVQGNQVSFFRPQVKAGGNVAPPPSRPAARKAVVSVAQLQASHPNRPGRVAGAQGGQPATPANPQPKARRTPKSTPATPASPAAPTTAADQRTYTPGKPKSQTETTPPAHTKRVQPQNPATQQPPAREPKQRTETPPPPAKRQPTPPPAQEKRRPEPPQQEKERAHQPPPQHPQSPKPNEEKERKPPPPPASR